MATSKIEFYVSCKDIKRSDVLSKSDPFAVASLGHKDKDGKMKYTEIGRTETIGNTSAPEFTHQFVLDFFFHEIQHIKVEVYDDDTVTADDCLGSATFTLGALFSSPGKSVTERLKERGVMIIRGEEVAFCADVCNLTIRGVKLANKDGLFGKSDPFFIISRLREDGEWQQVHKSSTIMNDLNPLWESADISVQALCNGDYLRPLRLDVWDWDRDGGHDAMGRLNTTLQALLEGMGNNLDLQHPKKNKKGKGQLRVERAEIHKKPTLIAYLAGGLQISMSVAVDFTASNGHPSHPESLHHVDPSGRLNQYQQAIVAIGSILQDYDSDKMFPVHGFGGKIGNAPTSHCFPIYRVSHSGASDEVHGVGGIMDAYAAALSSVVLSGPTLFSEVLQTAMAKASQPASQMDQRYNVLVILTDGIINDMRETIDNLVAAANLPMSVVIVGVGQADFSNMSVLDGDGKRLTDSANNRASRDIVQFAPFSKYPQGEGVELGSRVAADTMAEIPEQIIEYFSSRGVKPNLPRPPMPIPPHPPVPNASASYGGRAAFNPPPAYMT